MNNKIFIGFFLSIVLFVSNHMNGQFIRKSNEVWERDVLEVASSANFVFDGYAKSTYCYLSRKRMIYTVVKFHINHCYKGGLQLGDIYIFEPDVDGATQDGSNVGQITSDSEQHPISEGVSNFILFCNNYADTTVMPPNTTVLQERLLIPTLVLQTLNQDEREKYRREYAGNFGPHNFYDIDSMYCYLNNIYPFIEKQKIDTHKPKKVRLQWQDTAYIRNRSSDLSKSSYPKGGIDSLKEYIIQHFDWNIDCQCTTSGLNIQINIEKDGTVSNIFERFFKNEAVNNELRKLVAGIKFEPGVYKDGALIVRTVDYIFISKSEIAKQKSKK